MSTYLDAIKSFADVPITSDGVETASLLEAADGVVSAIGLFGIQGLLFLQTDLRAKIEVVRSRSMSHQETSSTLEKLIASEAQEGSKQGTECIIYLMRASLFGCRALENLQTDPTSELRACIKRSYDELGKPYHSAIMQSMVPFFIMAAPSRSEFYERLSQGAPHEELNVALSKTLKGLVLIVERVKRFLEEGGYGTV